MNIRNCRMCGHIFNYVAGPILCPHCREKMEAKFQEVKEYIRSNPGVGIQDVAENCDVEPSQIQQWIREERLSLSVAGADGIVCETCGKPIRTGRFCEKCKNNMANALAESIHKPEPPQPQETERDKNRMRFLK